jgi:hypothetical protein
MYKLRHDILVEAIPHLPIYERIESIESIRTRQPGLQALGSDYLRARPLGYLVFVSIGPLSFFSIFNKPSSSFIYREYQEPFQEHSSTLLKSSISRRCITCSLLSRCADFPRSLGQSRDCEFRRVESFSHLHTILTRLDLLDQEVVLHFVHVGYFICKKFHNVVTVRPSLPAHQLFDHPQCTLLLL